MAHEKNLVEKVKDEPKLFFNYVNKKMKHYVGISEINYAGTVYTQPEEICEIMPYEANFHMVFTDIGPFYGEQVK